MKRSIFLLSTLLGCFIVILSVSASTTHTALGNLGIYNTELRFLVPQGWGFFTREPRKEQICELYRVHGNTVEAVLLPSADAQNLFGLSRRQRKMEVELGEMASKVPHASWRFGNPLLTPALLHGQPTITVEVPDVHLLQGRYLFVMHEFVPWAWATKVSPLQAPAHFVYVNVNPSAQPL